MKEKLNDLKQRLRNEYRISIINEDTLAEHRHLRITVGRGILLALGVAFVSWLLFSLFILITPLRNYMPGYSVNIRHQLMEESAKVDSLVTSLELQRQYLNVITQVVAGEVSSDTIQSIDSMQLIMREKLLVAKSEVTADFIAQYESSEKDNLQLFETVLSANTSHPSNFFAPIHGAVTTPFSTKDRKYAITISSYGNKNASSTLDGTIISVLYGVNSQYSVIIQHTQFTSIYHGIQQPTKRVGDTVKAGEVIGMIKDNTLGFELWKNGQPNNPEEFIVF